MIAVKGLQKLNNLVYNQTGWYIGLFVIDGGKEFSIKELTNYTKSININVLCMAPYTFEQNKTPKHIGGIILGMAKLIRIEANLPKYLWDKSCKTAI